MGVTAGKHCDGAPREPFRGMLPYLHKQGMMLDTPMPDHDNAVRAAREMLPEIMNGRCIVFLGAGSTAACESLNGGGVTGEGLTKALIEFLGEDPGNFRTTLKEISEFIEARAPRYRHALDDFIHNRLRDLQPTAGHLLLTLFPWHALVTTNFNRVIEDAYRNASESGLTRYSCVPILADSDLTERLDAGGIPLFKPHGCISVLGDANTPVVLTARDYYVSARTRKKMYAHIKGLARKFITLFIGYSLDDYDFNNIYYELNATLGHSYVLQCYSVLSVPPDKKGYLREAYAHRHITLVDDKFDSFMVKLADVARLLTDDVCDEVARRLGRPPALRALGEEAGRLPECITRRLQSPNLGA